MGGLPKKSTKKEAKQAVVKNRLDIQVPDPLEDTKKAFQADNARLLEEIQNAKKDFIAIFGIFAAILIFLSIEVKIFDQPLRMPQIMGVSFFFLSALLVFALGIRSILTEKNNWKEFTKPAFIFAVVLLIISLECFYWGTHSNPVTHHGQYWFLGSK